MIFPSQKSVSFCCAPAVTLLAKLLKQRPQAKTVWWCNLSFPTFCVLSLVAKVFHLSWMGPQLSHPMFIYQATYTKKSMRLKLQHNHLLTFYFILEYSASQGHGGKESTWRLRRRWLEQELLALSSILVWEIPWTEEPGGLQSWGCRGRHD